MNILMRFFCWLGRYSIRQIRAIGRLALFSFHVFRNIPGALSRFYLIAQQTHFIGNYSLSIISVSGLFVGFVLGLQGYYVLVRYGSDQALGVMVALSLMRELGPVVAALLFVNFGVRTRAVISVVILVGYALLSKYVGAPDVPGGDPLSREGCLVGYVDRCLLPGRLLYDGGRFDPEGLLSALPAVVTALLGMFTGELIRLPKERMSGERKTLWMVVGAVVLAVVAIAGNSFVPVNKMLWSSTFVCAVGAYSLAMMALFYYVIDVRGHKGWTLFFRVVGMNSITIYMAQRIVSFGGIADFFVGGVAGLCPEQIAAVVTSAGYVAVCWLFLYFLYRKQVFLKI